MTVSRERIAEWRIIMKQYKNKKAMALLMAAVLAGSTLYSGVADAASYSVFLTDCYGICLVGSA